MTQRRLSRKATSDALSRKFSSAITEGNVTDLVDCGFSERIARTALNRKFGDMQSALDECLRLQAEQEPKIRELTAMGFSEAHVNIALDKCGDDLQGATEWLLTNTIEEAELMHSQPTVFKHPQARDLSDFFTPQTSLTDSSADSESVSGVQAVRDASPSEDLPILKHRPAYDSDMIARFEHRQKISNYEHTHLNPSNIAMRRAHSNRIHSDHQRSLLDFKAALIVEEELFGGLPIVEDEEEDDDDDIMIDPEIRRRSSVKVFEGNVEDYMSKLGHSNSWKLLQELQITAEMLRDEEQIPDEALAENIGLSMESVAQFRKAVLYSHHLTPKSKGNSSGGGTIGLVAEVDEGMIGISLDVTSDVGFDINQQLKVSVDRNGQAAKKGVCSGWKLLNAGGFDIASADDLSGALGALKMSDEPQKVVFTFNRESEPAVEASPVSTLSAHKRRPSAFMQDLSREEKIVQGKERLQKRLEAETLKEIEMVDDGNCQFRALSSECYGTQRWHRTIRSKVVDYMQQNASEFDIYFSDRPAFMSYLSSMRESGTWGDELTLRAACDLLNVKVYVITSEDENWLLHYDPPQKHSDRSLFITYICPIHYNTIEHDTSHHVAERAPIRKAPTGTLRKVEL